MSLDPYWLHLFILLVIAGAAYVAHVRTLRLRACYGLYRVRDAFVLLVARGVLQEDSRVFQHYYGRISQLLDDAPNVGIDDMLETIFRRGAPADFDKTLARAANQAKKMASDPAMNEPAVRQAVADYYVAIRAVILSHSSVLKLAYVVSRHLLGQAIVTRARAIVPGQISRGLSAVEYAETEASEFRPA